ncbi:MAG: UGSC family (seleno)protein [Gammaproteobacteria bacterium]|nr:UGSC family (seleno)protein [Gammaproteobacteria bacterium]
MSAITLRDPTAESAAVNRPRQPPPASLDGKTVALLDIGKMRGDEFVDRLEQLFTESKVSTKRYKKPTNTRTAPTEIIQDIVTETDVVVLALSDCGSCTSCSTHDLNDLDNLGIPGVSVLTTAFKQAFEQQCSKIGFDGASVYTPHPVLNRTTEQIHQFADSVFDEIRAAIVLSPAGGA